MFESGKLRQQEVTILNRYHDAAVVKIVANEWIDYLEMAKAGAWKIVNVLWAGRSSAITERIVIRARGGMLSFPCLERPYDFGKGWSADTDFFPYLPINHNATFQFVVDRASLREQLNRRLHVTGATRPTSLETRRW